MHALIAIDSFKNSITSIQANRIGANRCVAHGITATQVAIADGGEGTVAAWLANHAGGQAITASTVDLAQRPVTATYGYFATEKMAVIEGCGCIRNPVCHDDLDAVSNEYLWDRATD